MELSQEVLEALKQVVDQAESANKPAEEPQVTEADDTATKEVVEEKTDETAPEVKPEEQPVQQEQTEEVYINPDDLVLKPEFAEMLKEALAPLLARIDATDKQVGSILDKFVSTDVGNTQPPKGDDVNVSEGETFAAYASRFKD